LAAIDAVSTRVEPTEMLEPTKTRREEALASDASLPAELEDRRYRFFLNSHERSEKRTRSVHEVLRVRQVREVHRVRKVRANPENPANPENLANLELV
jgi:hypothetical protein